MGRTTRRRVPRSMADEDRQSGRPGPRRCRPWSSRADRSRRGERLSFHREDAKDAKGARRSGPARVRASMARAARAARETAGNGVGPASWRGSSSALAREPAPMLGPVFADLRALRVFAVRTEGARRVVTLGPRCRFGRRRGGTPRTRRVPRPQSGPSDNPHPRRPRWGRLLPARGPEAPPGGRRLAEVEDRSVGPRPQQGFLADLVDRHRRSLTSARNRPISLAEVDHRPVGPPLRQGPRAPIPHSESARGYDP